MTAGSSFLVTCLLGWMPASRVSAFMAPPAPATSRSFCGECGSKQVRQLGARPARVNRPEAACDSAHWWLNVTAPSTLVLF